MFTERNSHLWKKEKKIRVNPRDSWRKTLKSINVPLAGINVYRKEFAFVEERKKDTCKSE